MANQIVKSYRGTKTTASRLEVRRIETYSPTTTGPAVAFTVSLDGRESQALGASDMREIIEQLEAALTGV